MLGRNATLLDWAYNRLNEWSDKMTNKEETEEDENGKPQPTGKVKGTPSKYGKWS
jgi:hypothetical protein